MPEALSRRRKPDRQRLQLVDERRLGHHGTTVELHPRIAGERLLEQDVQFQPRQGGPEAKMAPTGYTRRLPFGKVFSINM